MINKTEIKKAQNSWGNGIITIGKLKDNPKECRIFTVNFISKHYDFDSGDVQFKPTKAFEKQFRNNNKSALSYFIGSDNDFATDPSGEKTKVEFSFVYKKNKEGEIKIVLHHSSFPFSM